VKLNFRIDSVYMKMNARIVRGLTHPLISGWVFFAKYQAFLHPPKGTLQFLSDKLVPLEPTSCTEKHQTPPGAKKLSIDYSKMAKDALTVEHH
jgi:hypothetical protein